MALAGWIVAALAILIAVAAVALMRRRDATSGTRTPSEAGTAVSDDRTLERAAFDALPVPALVADGESRVRAFNIAAAEAFPSIERGAELLTAFGELELAHRAVEVAQGGQPTDLDVRLFTDRRRTFRVRIAPDRAGRAVVSFSDQTAAADYTELRMQFVSNVSHELRTPLTGLRGLLEALDDEDLDDEHRVVFAQRAQHEAGRLSAIMEDVLLLSELETSSAPLAEEPTDLGEAASRAASSLTAAAHEAQVSVAVNAEDGLLVPVTPRIAEMVASNLLANAVRYAGPGSVTKLRVFADSEHAVLEVSDDGVGIPEEHLPHIFERFYRVDRSRSNQVGGTGLGLAIVKHIAERAGGKAEATSRVGYGTTVAVRLPRVRPDAGAASAEAQD